MVPPRADDLHGILALPDECVPAGLSLAFDELVAADRSARDAASAELRPRSASTCSARRTCSRLSVCHAGSWACDSSPGVDPSAGLAWTGCSGLRVLRSRAFDLMDSSGATVAGCSALSPLAQRLPSRSRRMTSLSVPVFLTILAFARAGVERDDLTESRLRILVHNLRGAGTPNLAGASPDAGLASMLRTWSALCPRSVTIQNTSPSRPSVTGVMRRDAAPTAGRLSNAVLR